MTDVGIKVRMPEKLERAARKAGLLSGAFVRDAIREELARRRAAGRLARNVEKFRTLGLAPVTPEEIELEIQAVRAAKRVARASHR